MALESSSCIPALSRIESFTSTAPGSWRRRLRNSLVLPAPPAASSAKLDGQPTRSTHGQGRASGGVHQASADSTSRKPARSSTTGWSIGRTYLSLPATRAPERATREGYPAPAQPLVIAATDRSTAGKRKVHIKAAARQDISLTATRATPPLECPAADPGGHQSEPETYLSGGYLSVPRWPLSGQPPGRLWLERLEPAVQEAEFVAFRVGQDVPALGAVLADVG